MLFPSAENNDNDNSEHNTHLPAQLCSGNYLT